LLTRHPGAEQCFCKKAQALRLDEERVITMEIKTETINRIIKALEAGDIGRRIGASSYGEASFYLRHGETLFAIAQYPTHRVLLIVDTAERYQQLEYKETPYALYAIDERELKQFLS